MRVVIRHSRADGTLVYGSEKGDGVYETLRGLQCGWRWMRSIQRIKLQQSRYKAAKRYEIGEAEKALRAAGYDVEVEIDDVTQPATTTAEREADQAERANQRADRYHTHAADAAARSQAAYARYRQSAGNWPPGQPILSASGRAAHKRMKGAFDTSVAEQDKARYWAGRRQAVEEHERHRQALPTILRRIERLAAHRRRLIRWLDGQYRWPDDDHDGGPVLRRSGGHLFHKVSPGQDHAARWTADLIQLDGELHYWREVVASKQEAGQKVWSKDDFQVGDFVKVNGTWFEVVRVNSKSVTVPWVIDGVTCSIYTVADARRRFPGQPKISTDTVPYNKIHGRASAQEIHAAITQASEEST